MKSLVSNVVCVWNRVREMLFLTCKGRPRSSDDEEDGDDASDDEDNKDSESSSQGEVIGVCVCMACVRA